MRSPTDTVSSTKNFPWLRKNESDSPSRFTTSRVEIAVVIHVDGVDAHARFAMPVLVERAPHGERRLAKAAAALIEPEMVRRAVVGHQDIDAAVAVEVGRDDAEAVADGGRQPGPRGHVGEGAVAVVVVTGVEADGKS